MSEVISGAPASVPASNSPVTEATAAPEVDMSADGEGEGVSTEPTPAQKEEIKRNIKKLKLKVDGRDIEEDYDLDDNDRLVRDLQKSKAFDRKAQEHSQLEKEVRSFIEELRKNPRKVLEDKSIGIDLKKLAAELIEEEIANSQKSPEQLEREKIESELKALKEEREKEKEEFQRKEFERIQEREFERYDTLMTKAIENSDLPKSPYVVKKMADYMLMGLQNGLDLSPEDVIGLVRDEIHSDVQSMFSVMPEEVVEGIIGKDVLNKLRKKNLAKAKGAPKAPAKTLDTGAKKEEAKGSEKKQTFKDLFGF